MQYSFKCPACDHVLTVDAQNDDEAVQKLMAAGGEHLSSMHPGMPMDPGMEGMVRSQMQKGVGTPPVQAMPNPEPPASMGAMPSAESQPTTDATATPTAMGTPETTGGGDNSGQGGQGTV